MFSSHLPPVHNVPREYIFAGAGLMLVIGLLVGIAMVASGQVKKAELRESLLSSQRIAVVQCMETLGGVELNNCLIQARSEPDAASRTTLADNSVSFSRSTAVSAGSSQGLMPVAFSARR
ncbi:hypothetical protein [Polaromonas sp.]|uniref:hypothetical protein n=1 Tax=Polaromonas sp. TaxID=1869339 RepID=UPI0037501E25